MICFRLLTRTQASAKKNRTGIGGVPGPVIVISVIVVSVILISVIVGLAIVILPALIRHIRSAMIEVLDSPFIRAARGHGIPRLRLMLRYALPAAANPLISLFGSCAATILSAGLLVEVILSWPGLGPLLVEAIQTRDVYEVVGVVMLSSLFLVLGNLFADILLFAADPRIRVE